MITMIGTRYLRLGYLTLLFLVYTAQAEKVFVHENLDPKDSEYQSTIVYVVDEKEVGHVSIQKLPLFSFYVLHTLYVYPEYRLNGYGRELIDYACNYLINANASKVYIQPGPFELDTEGHLVRPMQQYKAREKSLITLYAKCGFSYASLPLRACAYLMYACMGIRENPKHLMVKTI